MVFYLLPHPERCLTLDLMDGSTIDLCAGCARTIDAEQR
ncbi:hypothetical protein BV133_2653 [Blastochloris viridis]|uniref:Uncharacterized protein n=1 Tax=Blastochloris viridis TaxID=1079 RepID=A0A182D407_BLAVI|nr:hypothetical protein BV133_2653 [Blastochloris viridis]